MHFPELDIRHIVRLAFVGAAEALDSVVELLRASEERRGQLAAVEGGGTSGATCSLCRFALPTFKYVKDRPLWCQISQSSGPGRAQTVAGQRHDHPRERQRLSRTYLLSLVVHVERRFVLSKQEEGSPDLCVMLDGGRPGDV